jgi:tetratricopeptide (TPR) repeat protein
MANEKSSITEALGLSTKDVDEIAAVAAALYQEDRVESALKIFQGLICLQPERAEFWSALGAALTRTMRYEQAIPVLTIAVKMNPKDTAALVNRAECYIALADNERSSDDLQKAIELDPQQKDPASNRARQLAYGMNSFFEECQNENLDKIEVDE